MGKMSEEDFVLTAITALRRKDTVQTSDERRGLKGQEYGKYYGIGVEQSGFAAAFREYFGKDPMPVLERLEREDKIVIQRTLIGGLAYYRNEGKDPQYKWTIYDPKYLPPS